MARPELVRSVLTDCVHVFRDMPLAHFEVFCRCLLNDEEPGPVLRGSQDGARSSTNPIDTAVAGSIPDAQHSSLSTNNAAAAPSAAFEFSALVQSSTTPIDAAASGSPSAAKILDLTLSSTISGDKDAAAGNSTDLVLFTGPTSASGAQHSPDNANVADPSPAPKISASVQPSSALTEDAAITGPPSAAEIPASGNQPSTSHTNNAAVAQTGSNSARFRSRIAASRRLKSWINNAEKLPRLERTGILNFDMLTERFANPEKFAIRREATKTGGQVRSREEAEVPFIKFKGFDNLPSDPSSSSSSSCASYCSTINECEGVHKDHPPAATNGMTEEKWYVAALPLMKHCPIALRGAPCVHRNKCKLVKVCMQWHNKSGCPRGDACPYSHEVAVTCSDALVGRCKKRNCRRSHDQLLRTVMDQLRVVHEKGEYGL